MRRQIAFSHVLVTFDNGVNDGEPATTRRDSMEEVKVLKPSNEGFDVAATGQKLAARLRPHCVLIAR
ncbi:hypothetical protein BZM27_06945 [Paraburkholderia steynii]|uniref:Uncharacterized protein n=1 Tax=Paraburkholderia steynii TaxID=1245441 RepID=A0A4R0XJV5_9BURK|nr:hypothetical protein BZM27_06945 [Paraburkholderia steynii]